MSDPNDLDRLLRGETLDRESFKAVFRDVESLKVLRRRLAFQSMLSDAPTAASDATPDIQPMTRTEPAPAGSRFGGALAAWAPGLVFLALAYAVLRLVSGGVDPTLAVIDRWKQTQSVQFVASLALFVVAFTAIAILRQRGMRVAPMLSVVGLGLSFFTLLNWSTAEANQREERIRLSDVFLDHRWISYDPPQADPYRGKVPTLEEMERDLTLLHDAEKGPGCDGLITFKAHDVFGEIPRLARKVGFKKVIMGIHVHRDDTRAGSRIDPDEWQRAIAAREFVDAYCLGHNTSTRLDIATLRQWMADLRKATGKPVSTSAPLVNYLGERGKEWREIGDWHFPDVHGSWVHGASADEVFKELKESVLRVTELPRDRPILLKMVSMPANADEEAKRSGRFQYSDKEQERFYTAVTRDLYLPPGVFLSFYNGFDLPWMNHRDHPHEWSPGQEYVGIFTADGTKRPAVDVLRRGFPVQRRP